ncbi:MAG: DUF1460 domain-containing protein [Candidatus Riflebacteria bacterium]|nr:DUF1460 domain-containing protein [Candidatus Riflebacteria bacterium]
MLPSSLKKLILNLLLIILPMCSAIAESSGHIQPATVFIKNFQDAREAQRLISSAISLPPERRIPFISAYFLGRKYHPETKKRIKEERKQSTTRTEASNPQPLPVQIFQTDLTFLDCMTYVEQVMALANSEKADYSGSFIQRLIDITYSADGKPLMNHQRNHFTSQWADINESKGYLKNIARNHPEAKVRTVFLNKVGNNRTFYVEDRFMIATSAQTIWYFPSQAVFAGKLPLISGDILALVCDKEGLDVTHMAFYIEQSGKKIFRHASYTKNRVVDDDFLSYLRGNKDFKGLMVLRPIFEAPQPPIYRVLAKD